MKHNANKLPETKLLITKDLLFVFEVETIQDESNDHDHERIGDVVKVKDLDIFSFKDFEFMQKVPNQPL